MPIALLAVGESLSGSGGLARVAREQKHALAALGWTVSVLCPDDLPRPWRSRRYPALNPALLSWQLSALARRSLPAGAWLFSHGMCGARGPAARQVHLYHGSCAALAEACRPGLDRLEYRILRNLCGMLEARGSRGGRAAAVSRGAAADLQRLHGLPGLRVLHNPVDPEHFRPEGARRREAPGFLGLCVGRLDYGKGRDVVRRLGELLPPEHRLALAAPEVRGEVDWPDGRLLRLGRVEYDRLPETYRGADYLLCASRYEGFGLTLLEAWACGIPVVTTRVGIVPELLGEEPALDELVVDDPDDAEGFAARIERLRREPELARRQGEWGRRLVLERFSPDRYRARWAMLLEEWIR